MTLLGYVFGAFGLRNIIEGLKAHTADETTSGI